MNVPGAVEITLELNLLMREQVLPSLERFGFDTSGIGGHHYRSDAKRDGADADSNRPDPVVSNVNPEAADTGRITVTRSAPFSTSDDPEGVQCHRCHVGRATARGRPFTPGFQAPVRVWG